MQDLNRVLVEARKSWEKDHKSRMGVQDRIGNSVPWWLVIVALVFFALSAPHTAVIFNYLTPTAGYLAPFGVEFGLLYAAFYRHRAKQQSSKTGLVLWFLTVLMIVASVIVNGAGSAVAVINAIGLDHLSLTEVMTKLPEIPVTSTIALVLVPFAALMIPAGTWVAGEGLAQLFLDRRQGNDTIEEDWRLVSSRVEYEALYNHLIDQGYTITRAASTASNYINGRYQKNVYEQRQTASVKLPPPDLNTVYKQPGNGVYKHEQTPFANTDEQIVYVDEQPQTAFINAPEDGPEDPVQYVLDLFDKQPELVEVSVRKLAAQVGVKEWAVHKARTIYREKNGRSE